MVRAVRGRLRPLPNSQGLETEASLTVETPETVFLDFVPGLTRSLDGLP